MSQLITTKTIANFTACLMSICLISDFSAAHFSYTIILFILFTIYDFLRNNQIINLKNLHFDKTVCTGIFIFYLSLLFSCLYRQDLSSLTGLLLYVSWIIPAILFLCISSKYDIRAGLSIGVCFGLILLCTLGLAINPPKVNIIDFRFTSIKYNANQTAMIIELLVPCLIYFFLKKKCTYYRIFYSLGIILPLICLLATQSRGGIGSFIVGAMISLGIYFAQKGNFASPENAPILYSQLNCYNSMLHRTIYS